VFETRRETHAKALSYAHHRCTGYYDEKRVGVFSPKWGEKLWEGVRKIYQGEENVFSKPLKEIYLYKI